MASPLNRDKKNDLEYAHCFELQLTYLNILGVQWSTNGVAKNKDMLKKEHYFRQATVM